MESKVWGVCCFFNPVGYKSMKRKYDIFRNFSKQQGLKLITVELGFNNTYYLSDNDAEIYVRLDDGDIMWQKERLINIGLKYVPDDCTYIVLPDTDVIMLSNTWISDLENSGLNCLQPYNDFTRVEILGDSFSTMSFEYFNNHIRNFGSEWHPSGVKMNKNGIAWEKLQPGFIWALKANILKQVGLYEYCIVGGGHRLLINKLLGIGFRGHQYTEAQMKGIEEWGEKIKKLVNGKIGYLDTDLVTLIHGEFLDRRYVKRHQITQKFNFDPSSHVTGDMALKFTSLVPEESKEDIKNYFIGRKEDNETINTNGILDLYFNKLEA